MNIRILESTPEKTFIVLEGDLDLAGVETIEASFLEAISTQKNTVVVDLSKVSFLASLGMRLLLQAHKTLRHSGGRFFLLHPTPRIKKILIDAGMESIATITDDAKLPSA